LTVAAVSAALSVHIAALTGSIQALAATLLAPAGT